MELSYLGKMRLTDAFLAEYRLRLTDKPVDRLPPEGMHYDTTEPSRKCLVGCLGPLPSPDYHGPQAPNALGMVLMATANDNGKLRLTVAGQFDVVHRYIPSIAHMEKALVKDTYGQKSQPRRSQLISPTYQRYTLSFDNLHIELDTRSPNQWVVGALAPVLDAHRQSLLRDPRVMRRCVTNPNGGARFNFTWRDGLLDSQDDFNAVVYSQIIDRDDDILDYHVQLRCRVRPAPQAFGKFESPAWLVELYLENQTSYEQAKPYGLDAPYLLDTRLQVQLTDGTAHDVPHRLRPEDYRYRDEDGVPGYGVTCAVERTLDGTFVSNTMPTLRQPRVDTPSARDSGMSLVPNYADLARDPMPILDDLVAALRIYDGKWQQRIVELADAGADEQDVATEDHGAFLQELGRIEAGVELLRQNGRLRQAFQWMNEAMLAAIQLQGKAFTGWHLFQLGFILTQVPSIYERHAAPDKLNGELDIAEVLWFSTGGGKTEAYLGIISMMMLYTRMQGREYGVTAWMRFPLRMLSVQQFQRLSYVVAQSNRIREREALGGFPFTIGYYTGTGTPSKISTAGNFDTGKTFLPEISESRLQAFKFISDCPYCGAKGSIQIRPNLEKGRIQHYCSNATCWSNTQASSGDRGEGLSQELGIFVSDEEVYRYLPTVLVGTVDKLAVIGHNRRFASFFGGARYFCPEHGFSQKSTCEHARIVATHNGYESKPCANNTRNSKIRVATLKPMVDPGFQLQIQDELHLLSESLGNFSGHYEGLLQTLQLRFGGRPVKILCATATIKEYSQHVWHLYQKRAVRFPVPGTHQGESFYSRKATAPESGEPLFRRLFTGILPIGRGQVTMRAVAGASQHYLDQVDAWRVRLRDNGAQLMEQAGLPAAMASAALAYVEKNQSTHLLYANSKRNINTIESQLVELDRPDHPRPFQRLDGDTPLDDILGAIHRVETKGPDDPKRTLIATSVVSHGVDIAELNFMIMAGWPKSVAEYIQASARCGRVHPGIVLAVLSSHQLFETNVFLNFNDYHFFIDRLVESVPINRFAPNVLDRTLPGVIAATIINWACCQKWGEKLDQKVLSLVTLLQSPMGGHASQAIRDTVMQCLGVPNHMLNMFDPRVISDFKNSLERKVNNALYELERWPPSKHDQWLSEALGDIFGHPPFRSFRDIENQIVIRPVNSEPELILNALAR